MEQKTKAFINAFKILAQLPPGAMKTRTLDVLFTSDRQILVDDLPTDSVVYDAVCSNDITTRRLTIRIPENREICITAVMGGREEAFTVIGDEGM